VSITARAGDREAVIWLEGLFEPYRDRDIPCFLCDAVVSFPPHCSIVGDLADAEKCVAVPSCSDCGALPPDGEVEPYPENVPREAQSPDRQKRPLPIAAALNKKGEVRGLAPS
jgi:hypothetical protein